MAVLIEMLGAIALLLWGLRTVRTGVMRAYGPKLKRLARVSEGRVFPMFFSGMFFAIFVQSSTATAIIVSTFAGQNILSTSSALIAILGADVGTAIAVLIASQKMTLLSPALIAVGVFGYLATDSSKGKNVFRALTGLGLILLALSLISKVGTNLSQVEEFNTVLQVFVTQPALMLMFGVILTYMAHSSLAIVLMTVGFVQAGLLSTEASLFLVLGANIGSGLLPVVASWNSRLNARVPVTANLLLRMLGAAAIFPFVGNLVTTYGGLVSTSAIPAMFHLGLNLAVAVAGLILSPLALKLSRALLPGDAANDSAIEPKHLDETAFSSPGQALACAKREALNMADIAQTMVRQTLPALKDGHDDLRREVVGMDDSVDTLFDAIKIYLARVMREELTEDESQRAMDLLSFTANMEHIGDIVDGSLMELAAKKNDLGAQFSKQGLAEITALHEAVCSTFELAINTFVSEDSELARMLYEAKAEVREIETRSVTTHLERIGTGVSDSIETSNLHLDVIRDLKRVNSHLTSIAYPVLKASGEIPKTKWNRPAE